MEYVTHFMEGQQSLLDEVYVLVAQTSSTTCWSRQQQCNNECFLCCRCIFLMILNSYCAHESSIVNSECDGWGRDQKLVDFLIPIRLLLKGGVKNEFTPVHAACHGGPYSIAVLGQNSDQIGVLGENGWVPLSYTMLPEDGGLSTNTWRLRLTVTIEINEPILCVPFGEEGRVCQPFRTLVIVSVMELCSWVDSAENLWIGMLQKVQGPSSDECLWIIQPRLSLSDLMDFMQSIPESLTVTRVKYSGQPLHWNVMEENPLNKKGRARVMSVVPDPEFVSWAITAHPKALQLACFTTTTRKVTGCGNSSLKTFLLRSRPMNVVFDLQGSPCRSFQATANTAAIFKYLLRYHGYKFDQQQQGFLETILPKKAVIRRLLRIEGADFLSFIQRLPGRKMAVFYNGDREGAQSGYFVNGVGQLQVFCWVPPWATQAIEHCTHVQIDASFKAAKPYVFYVPQAVIANRGLAYGLAIAPTEREELYSHFYDLLNFGETGLPHPPALADLGTAISSFAAAAGLSMFMCHRHILEAIGSASFAVSLFRPLPKTHPPFPYPLKSPSQISRNFATIYEAYTDENEDILSPHRWQYTLHWNFLLSSASLFPLSSDERHHRHFLDLESSSERELNGIHSLEASCKTKRHCYYQHRLQEWGWKQAQLTSRQPQERHQLVVPHLAHAMNGTCHIFYQYH